MTNNIRTRELKSYKEWNIIKKTNIETKETEYEATWEGHIVYGTTLEGLKWNINNKLTMLARLQSDKEFNVSRETKKQLEDERKNEEQSKAVSQEENVSRETWKGREGIEIESINCTEETMTDERYRVSMTRHASMVGDYKMWYYPTENTYAIKKGDAEIRTSIVEEEAFWFMRFYYDCELIESNRALHYRGHIIFKTCYLGKVEYVGTRKGDTVNATERHEKIIDVMNEIDEKIKTIYEENGDDIERTYLPEYSNHGWKVYRWYVADAGEYVYRGQFGEHWEIWNTLDGLLEIVNNTFRGWLIEEYDEDDFVGYAAKPVGAQNYKIWGKHIIEMKTRISTYIERE